MENFVVNRNGQIDINRKVENSYGFRLQEINHNTEICSNKDLFDETATSVSSYSNFKQRIDAMFDDSRSLFSETSRNEKKVNLYDKDGHTGLHKDRIITNNIQEKIEKMFMEVSQQKAISDGKKSIRRPEENLRTSAKNRDFKVIYLGSKPLREKGVSLTSLQEPLRELYFEFKRTPEEDQVNVLTISKEGLKIRETGSKEELHPFPTIAVWASVKLSFRVVSDVTEYAFLPLVTEPDGIDKNVLFKVLKNEDKRLIAQNFSNKIDSQSPIFTVVMKNVNLNKQLECHGFVCKSSEEAIVIAANLYKALMKKLKRRKELKEQNNARDAGKNEILHALKPEEVRSKPKVKVKKPAPAAPARPPRKPKPCLDQGNDTANEAFEEAKDLEIRKDSEGAPKEPEAKGGEAKRRGSVPENMFTASAEPLGRSLRRTASDSGGHHRITVEEHRDVAGDILTKVAIPRSGSFLNANGPLARFSRRHGTDAQSDVLSPLGFKELFNEFRLHEGLENMDDILNAIIDAEGMSFNDLKPIYKEFLLKLAMTLTKDELYQRSKIIMRRQRKRNSNCSFRKKTFISTIGLRKVFKKTCRLGKNKNLRPTNLEFTSVIFQSNNKQFDSKLTNVLKNKTKGFGGKRKHSGHKRLTRRPDNTKSKYLTTPTPDGADFFRQQRSTHNGIGGPNRSSSGYFSCSDCSYDSENCTCTSADKCYCSSAYKKQSVTSSSRESDFVSKNKSNCCINGRLGVEKELEDSMKSCSCDTESCADSGKCYCTYGDKFKGKNFHADDTIRGVCQTPHLHSKESFHEVSPCLGRARAGAMESIFDQLKEQGFAASDSSLSRAASPTTAWRKNERDTRLKECSKTTKSLEFYQIQRPKHRRQNVDGYLHKSQFENGFAVETEKLLRTSCGENYGDRNVINGYLRGSQQLPSVTSGRRQYNSLRCRNDFLRDLTNSGPLYRSVSCRTKHFFNSVRSKHSCDNIMNHIKFPTAGSTTSSLRFPRRMDVYNSFSEGDTLNFNGDPNIMSNCKENRKKTAFECCANLEETHKFHHQRHEKHFQRLNHHNISHQDSSSIRSKKKILVVSARDPKGKVLYMGASNRCENSPENSRDSHDVAATNASEALAVKKSAEIAALFSDASSRPKTSRPDHVIDQKQSHFRPRFNSYKSTNLENSLGYLP